MIEVIAERLNANDETLFVGEVQVDSRTEVKQGELILSVEGSKGTKDLFAQEAGIVFLLVEPGDEVPVGHTLFLLFPSIEELDSWASQGKEQKKPSLQPDVQITRKAQKLMQEYGISDEVVFQRVKKGVISAQDVEELHRLMHQGEKKPSLQKKVSWDLERVMIVGGGSAADVIANALLLSRNQTLWGIVDPKDSSSFPGIHHVRQEHEAFISSCDRKAFDSVIVSFGHLPTRKRLFELYREAGFSFSNVIHPSALVEGGTRMGQGNFLDAHVRVGVFSRIGNNNWIAAKVNMDHHNSLGDSSLLGPGVMTSGLVKIGSSSLIGAGTAITPSVEIGDGCFVAAGSVVARNLPSGEKIKVKV
ncbi:MAG TPA: DapH/DapD/GlmU-related protein [Thermotogota bacterium]|mgnify:CR=1 FL=1|nr:DapH/DapD/GlmU-related protein [Thermotogota bacterium]HRW93940.1 DapH/DapD/GlmU-related protein [Thermotogota bacterium]